MIITTTPVRNCLIVLFVAVRSFVIEHPVSCQGECVNIPGNSIYSHDLLFHESTVIVMASAN